MTARHKLLQYFGETKILIDLATIIIINIQNHVRFFKRPETADPNNSI